jgi:hypothetical protein
VGWWPTSRTSCEGIWVISPVIRPQQQKAATSPLIYDLIRRLFSAHTSLVPSRNRDSFCYVNDAVLGIISMQEHFDRILCSPSSATHQLRNLTLRALSGTSTLTFITVMVWRRLSLTTEEYFRCHSTDTARDSFPVPVIHRISVRATMTPTMTASSRVVSP